MRRWETEEGKIVVRVERGTERDRGYKTFKPGIVYKCSEKVCRLMIVVRPSVTAFLHR